MTQTLLRRLYSLIVPGGVLLLGAMAFLRWASPETVEALLRVYPYAVFGAGILLGWRFNRRQLVLALLVLALAERALLYFPGDELAATDIGRVVFHSTAVLLPFNLAALGLLGERGVLLRRSGVGLGLILLQVLLVAALSSFAPAEVAGFLERPFVAGPSVGGTPMAQTGLAVFGLAFVSLMARCVLSRKPLDNGFLWALVAGFLALSTGGGGPVATLYLATAGLILTVAVIEAGYAMAYRDELTRLPGRRALNETLHQLGAEYAVAMVDVDHFKKFNDTYGHDAGDQVLKMVASRLERVSGGGRAFRYGGEEFSVLFPGKSAEEVLPHLERVRKTIETLRFTLRGRDRPRKKPKKPRAGSGGTGKQVSVTVSIGVAEPDESHTKPEQVVQAADKALYRAKKGGRNQVRI